MELIIDTSSEELIVILKQGNNVLEGERLRGKHQETLLPQIDTLLKRAKKTPKDIDVYGVVVGPGSFTGVRLAVSTVKAFCSVFDAKIVAIDMLDLLGTKLKVGQCVAIKCTSQKLYLAKKEKDGLLKQVALTEDLLTVVQSGSLFGYNLAEIDGISISPIQLDANDYIAFVEGEIDNKNFVSAKTLEPVYMALSQAEEELLKKSDTEIIPFEDKYAEEMYQLQDAVMPLADKMTKKSFMGEFSQETRTYFVAKRGEVVVGYVGLMACDSDQNIISIAVMSSLWGQGIGRLLLGRAKCFAKENGCKTLSLEVDEKNTRAIEFYKKFGFEVTNIRKKYYKDSDALVMFLKI